MDDLKYKYLKNAKVATNRTENLKVLNEGVFSSVRAANQGQDYDPSVHGGSLFSWAAHGLVSKSKQNAIKNKYNKALNDFVQAVIQNNGVNAQVELSSKLKQFTLYPDTNQKKPEQSKSWVKHLILDLFDILNKSKNSGVTIPATPVNKGGVLSRIGSKIKSAFTTPQQNPSATVPQQTSPMYNSRLREYIETLMSADEFLEEGKNDIVSTDPNSPYYNMTRRQVAAQKTGRTLNLDQQAVQQLRNANTPQSIAQRRASNTPETQRQAEVQRMQTVRDPKVKAAQVKAQERGQRTITPEVIKQIIATLVKHPVWKTVGGWQENDVDVSGASSGQVLKDLGFANISSTDELLIKLDTEQNKKLKDAINIANNQNDKEGSEQRKAQLKTLFSNIIKIFNSKNDNTKQANDKFLKALDDLSSKVPDSSFIESISEKNTKEMRFLGSAYDTYKKGYRVGGGSRDLTYNQNLLQNFQKRAEDMQKGNILTNYNLNLISRANQAINDARPNAAPDLDWNGIIADVQSQQP